MVTITMPTKKERWIPSGNPIIITLSTTTADPHLSYIVEVIINGGLAARLKYPVFDRKKMNIDVHGIVNDFLSENFVNDEILTPANTLVYPTNETASLSVKVTEEYWNGSFMYQDTPVSSYNIYVWRAAADFQKSRDLSVFYEPFTYSSTNKHPKFLGAKLNAYGSLGSPLDVYHLKGTPAFFSNAYKVSTETIRTISFFTYGQMNSTPGDITQRFEVYCLDADFIVTKRFRWTNTEYLSYTLSDYTKKISQLPCTPKNLNLMPWSSIVLQTGQYNYITPLEDKYYIVHWGNPEQLALGCGSVPFEIVDCGKYQVFDILYKTAEGGWWQIRADRKHHKETEVKTTIKNNTWGLSAGEIMPNDKRFFETVHTTANGTIILNTDWIKNQYYIDEVEEMIISPSIYLIKEGATPEYIPVTLKDTTTEIKQVGQDKLIQYQFEFLEAYNKPTVI